MDSDILYLLWLCSRYGIGPAATLSLMKHFKSAKAVYEVKDALELRVVSHLSKTGIESIVVKKSLDEAKRMIERMDKNDIKYVTYFDATYPKLLKSIDLAPFILFYKGTNIFPSYEPAIAIVGSRKATTYGLNQAYKLAGELGKSGITIVSGLATGVDRASHIGAMDNGAMTIGVLGSGVDVIYPRGSKKTYDAMIASGNMVISEFLPGEEPLAQNFPRRNRIISGLCLGSVIVEAAKRSGSLITADYALSQGREVFAFPGNTTSAMSEGTNKLIKEGAKFITEASDIINDLYPQLKMKINEVKESEAPYNLSAEENEVYQRIREGIATKDELCRTLGYSISQVNTLVTLLELGGLITSENGKLYII